ncbi:MAG: adenylate kinase [Methanocellales archaeon]|nr:adenylate kinase [Methanocellales archaeon]MDD4898474.1 adenylate kinase [Methanocellales archaeon]MDD5447227.1 adenylate kinase [Methanocellales archaeon]
MGKLVAITGVPGVGKSTVVQFALEGIKEKYEIMNFGDYMFDAAKEAGLVEHRDAMRTQMPLETYKVIQELAAEKISSESKEMNVILDTHCSVLKPQGYYPGLPHHVLKKLPLELLVVVESSEEGITARRIKDESIRKREEPIIEQQRLNRMYAAACSVLTGVPLLILQNEQGKAKEAGDKLRMVLEGI